MVVMVTVRMTGMVVMAVVICNSSVHGGCAVTVYDIYLNILYSA